MPALQKREPVASVIAQDANMQMFSPVNAMAQPKSSPVSSMPTTPTPVTVEAPAPTQSFTKSAEASLKQAIALDQPAAKTVDLKSTSPSESTHQRNVQPQPQKPVERNQEAKPDVQALPKAANHSEPAKATLGNTDTAVNRLRDTILHQASTAMTSHGPTQQSQFSMSLLQSILDDALSSFRSDLRRDVHNMHLELLRQFEIQRGEMASLVHRVVSDAVRDSGRTRAPDLDENDAGFWADLHRL
jgi:hypothetical protein